jgi:hypothetical protein
LEGIVKGGHALTVDEVDSGVVDGDPFKHVTIFSTGGDIEHSRMARELGTESLDSSQLITDKRQKYASPGGFGACVNRYRSWRSGHIDTMKKQTKCLNSEGGFDHLLTAQELDIGSVDKVLDEINEQSDQMAQIQDAMAQPIGGAAQIDEDDLLAELEVRDTFFSNFLEHTLTVPCSLVCNS